ncbi:MAG TPA: type II toxin-antitoxin system RelE/ParE family toxin [Planctomycetota bacterium]|nr:type II toxin-antitoxin system RelE/ParE family toxin [Planctomycetota bacterium]
MSLVVRPAAAADLEEGFVWYEGQRTGLGDEFLDAVGQVFSAVLESPRRYRVVHRETRRAHLRRFPYSVFYRIVGEDVVVVACFHGSRNPRRWEGRR